MSMQYSLPKYPLNLSNSLFSPEGILRPDGYQKLMMSLAELQQNPAPSQNAQLISQDHVVWVLLSLSIRIYKMPCPGQQLLAQSWNTWHRGILTRRDVSFLDREGNLMFSAASFHTLIDYNTRKICREHPAYNTATKKLGPEQFEAGSRIPFLPGSGTMVMERTVMPSWLDLLGHVNNTRYGEAVYDCMMPHQRSRLEFLEALDFYFLHELRKDEQFTLYMDEKDNILDISALKLPSQQPTFGARLIFKNLR